MKSAAIALAATLFIGVSSTLSGEIPLTGVEENNTEKKDKPAEIKIIKKKPDIIKFNNNDKLHGKLIEGSSKGITWTCPNATDKILFKLENITEIKLGTKVLKKSNASIQLTNGDNIKGNIISLDKNSLLFETWYGGKLKIARSMIKRIVPGSVGSAIYSGPKDITKWITTKYNNNSVTLKEKALIMPRYTLAGKDVKLPDMARIDFKLPIQANQVNVFLYTDKIERHSINAYMLNISDNWIYLQRYSRDRGSDSLGQAEIFKHDTPVDMNKKSRHFTFLVDKKKKKFTILLDGKIIKELSDSNDFAGTGTSIAFYNSSRMPITVGDIEVNKWNGQLPNSSSDKELPKDVVEFTNDDKVTGNLEEIKDATMTFKTDFATLTVPMERIKAVSTATEDQQRARRRKNDVKLFFNDQNFITVDFENIKDGILSGSSENFGKTEFKMSAFDKIQFNIYREKKED